MARPRKPTALHVIQGTMRASTKKQRENTLELEPGSPGDAPEWFDATARDEWERLTKDPDYSQVLSAVHRGALIEYCVLFGRMMAEARGDGKISASERQTLNSLRMQLGITPASQSKVKTTGKQQPKNKWADVG